MSWGMHDRVAPVEEKNGGRIRSVDGLRGVADLAVVAYHHTGGALHRLLPGGQFVTLFFILSGLVLSTAPFRWLGRVSFSLYLTHLLARDWIVPHIPVRGALRPVLLILLCLLVAEAFHLLVERPASRKLGR